MVDVVNFLIGTIDCVTSSTLHGIEVGDSILELEKLGLLLLSEPSDLVEFECLGLATFHDY